MNALCVSRRFLFVLTSGLLCAGLFATVNLRGDDAPKGAKTMFGMIGKMTAAPGKRDELIAILLQATKEMPGCLSYVIAKDPADATSIWVTEVWEDQASHKASLSLPAVQQAIGKARPMIAKFDQSVVTQPVGGHGLTAAKRP
jgi:quinol monooxygenase YgiN